MNTSAQVKRHPRRPIDAALRDRMIKLYADHLSIREVAVMVDRSYGAVRRVLVDAQIEGRVTIRPRGPAERVLAQR